MPFGCTMRLTPPHVFEPSDGTDAPLSEPSLVPTSHERTMSPPMQKLSMIHVDTSMDVAVERADTAAPTVILQRTCHNPEVDALAIVFIAALGPAAVIVD